MLVGLMPPTSGRVLWDGVDIQDDLTTYKTLIGCGTVKLNVSSKPKSIDLIIAEGNDAGKTQLGVYELDGDTVSVTLAMPGETARPSALTRGALHVVLKRVK